MRVLSLSLMVVAMALVHSAVAGGVCHKHQYHGTSGGVNGMVDLNATQMDMEGPLDETNWANDDQAVAPIPAEQQGEAVAFEA
ncbi:hypothetical protein CKAH01_08776 [Colletotrichum kahawae]|uniref:Secreted protein n=1 Tax=Colletotrichum kahawae TaxID=34407 RepID=A0AAD9Y3C0_COLKA|nr:hypothetical protein CcaCcLH18_01231 [Colletotrichum camelliae]KAK2731904.1 hypothetical protein CKAH01_08776 [Colletotrichum kahawae]